jgi:hypothetical protein
MIYVEWLKNMKKTIKEYLPKESEQKEQICVRLSNAQKKSVIQTANSMDMSGNKFVVTAIRYFMEQGLSKSFEK